MYRHFKSKSALLEAAVEEHLSSVASAREGFGLAGEFGTGEARDLGAWILQEMDRQQNITRVLERDGSRLPSLRERFRTEVSDAGYAGMAEILERWLLSADGQRGHSRKGTAARGVTSVGRPPARITGHVRRSEWTLGATPLAIDEDALLDAWTSLCDAVLRSATR